jgi:hypothetical protein
VQALAAGRDRTTGEEHHMIYNILIIILILALVGMLPAWPYSANWGYFPSGGVTLIIVVLVILALSGRA